MGLVSLASHFLEGHGSRPGTENKLLACMGGSAAGDRVATARRRAIFFRIEATNILKPKEDTPGPNPTRTHFGRGENGGPGGCNVEANSNITAKVTLTETVRLQHGFGGSETGSATGRRTMLFQDRTHQYVENKRRHPGTEPNTNPF